MAKRPEVEFPLGKPIAPRKLDKKGYAFYVVNSAGKIDSGWEYREDAEDARRDGPYPAARRVYSRKFLVGRTLDPADNASWAPLTSGQVVAPDPLTGAARSGILNDDYAAQRGAPNRNRVGPWEAHRAEIVRALAHMASNTDDQRLSADIDALPVFADGRRGVVIVETGGTPDGLAEAVYRALRFKYGERVEYGATAGIEVDGWPTARGPANRMRLHAGALRPVKFDYVTATPSESAGFQHDPVVIEIRDWSVALPPGVRSRIVLRVGTDDTVHVFANDARLDAPTGHSTEFVLVVSRGRLPTLAATLYQRYEGDLSAFYPVRDAELFLQGSEEIADAIGDGWRRLTNVALASKLLHQINEAR